jgi:hypothetical protein
MLNTCGRNTLANLGELILQIITESQIKTWGTHSSDNYEDTLHAEACHGIKKEEVYRLQQAVYFPANHRPLTPPLQKLSSTPHGDLQAA